MGKFDVLVKEQTLSIHLNWALVLNRCFFSSSFE